MQNNVTIRIYFMIREYPDVILGPQVVVFNVYFWSYRYYWIFALIIGVIVLICIVTSIAWCCRYRKNKYTLLRNSEGLLNP